jgi:hypothetical protein
MLGIYGVTHAATFTVTNINDSGAGSYRQAVIDANAAAGADVIVFNIGGGGPQTIALSSVVTITTEIYVDGTSQPGYTGTPLISFTGTNAFQLNASSGSTITALNISGNASGIGITITNCTNLVIDNNNLSGMLHALRADGNNANIQFTNNNGANAANFALYLNSGTNNGWTITGNNLTNSASWAIHHSNGTPAAIDNNDLSGSRFGLYMLGANTFTLSAPGSGGPNENIYGAHEQTLYLNACSNVNVSNWDFTASTLAPANTRTPFYINNCSNLVIDNNNLSGMYHAFRADGNNTNIQFTNNNGADAANFALYLNNGVNNGWTITGNNLTNGSSWAIHHSNGTPAAIDNNDLSGSRFGLYMLGASTFTLSAPGSGGPNENIYGAHEQTLYLNACSNVNVSNWDFTATTLAPANTRTPFYINNCSNLVIDNNNLSGMYHAFRADGNNANIQFTNNNGANAVNIALYLNNGTNNGWTITGNDLTNAGSWALHASNGTQTNISNNDMSGSVHGLYMQGANTFTVGANTYGNTTGTDIYLNACTSVTLNNAVVIGTGGTGILINNSNTCNINGTEACGRQYGIYLTGTCTANNILNSQIANSTSQGIRVESATVSNTTIDQSDFFNNATDIFDGGTGTVVTNSTTLGSAPFCPCVAPADQSLAAAASTIICEGATSITLASSENGVNYFLRNDADNTIVGGPVAGNGSAVSLNTGSISSTTDYNVIAWSTPSATSQALHFDGANDHVNCGTTADFDITGDITVELWFYADVIPSDWVRLAGKGTGSNRPYGLWLSSGGSILWQMYGSSNGDFSTGAIITPGQWYHVAGVRQGTTMRLYVNGVEVTNGTYTGTTSVSPQPFTMGSDLVLHDYLQGSIDEVRLWNVARNTTEISNDMTNCLAGNETGLVAYYPIEQGTGATQVIDLAGGNHGNLVNMDPSTDWVAGAATCGACISVMSATATVTVEPIGDESVTAADATVCPNTGTTIDLGSSQPDVFYFLRNDADNSTIAGPVSGTGSGISMNTGNIPASTTYNVLGTNSLSLDFDGSNDFVALGGVAVAGNAARTVEFWVKTTDTDGMMVSTGTASNSLAFNIRVLGGYLSFMGYGNDFNPSSGTLINDNVWHHIAVTYDGNNLTGYIDGVQEWTTTKVLNTTGQNNFMGKSNHAGFEAYFAGSLDNARFWNSALSAVEISAIMTECLSGSEANLTAAYTFNDGAGSSTLTDLSGSFNGTLTNMDPATDWNFGSPGCTCEFEMTAIETVTVQDNAPTLASTPGNISVNVDAGACGAVVNYTAPTFDDDCDGASLTGILTAGIASGSAFPLGITTIEYTYTDGSAQSISESFTITVVDNEAPTIDPMADVVVNANDLNCSASGVSLGTPVTADNCNVASVSNNAPANFPTGSTIVTWTVTDDAGNSATTMQNVTVTTDLAGSVIETPAGCNGDATGSADLTVTGGTAGYTYLWDDASASTTEDISGLSAGSYNVIITDANGCTAAASVTVTEPSALVITVDGSTNPTGCGVADGSAFISVSGGTVASTYTYSWSDGASYTSSMEDPSDIPAGNIQVTVTDDNSCVATASVALSDPNGPTIALDASLSVLSLDCNGDSDGDIQIDVTLNGGASSAAYLWDDAAMTTTEDLSGLVAGTYTVTVTDNNGCSATSSYTINEPAAINLSEVHTDEMTGSDATIDLTVFGGTPSYVVAWTGPAGFTASTEDLSGLIAGTYDVTVTDANGCTQTLQVVISSHVSISSVQLSGISVYPNPTTGIVQVNGSFDNASIVVRDALGRIVYGERVTGTSATLHLENQSSGLYFIEVKTGNTTEVVRLGIQK